MPDRSDPPPALYQSTLHSLPLLARGKVRDNYAVGRDRLLGWPRALLARIGVGDGR